LVLLLLFSANYSYAQTLQAVAADQGIPVATTENNTWQNVLSLPSISQRCLVILAVISKLDRPIFNLLKP